MRDYKAEAEQMEVQLAGCSTAAMGATKDPATRGMWGWHPAYQDVLELRLKYDALQDELRQVRETLLTIQEAMLTPEEFRELAQWAPYPSLQEKTKKLAAALEGPRK